MCWMAQQVKPDEDLRKDGIVGPRHALQDLRDSALQRLKNRGSSAACEQIERAIQELPDLPWLHYSLLEAKEFVNRNSWVPLSPQQIRRIAKDPDARLVESGAHLLRVVTESLGRLQVRLQGENPMAPAVWNESPRRCPKDEGRFSDFIVDHLRSDLWGRGIVLNREVVVRRGDKPTPGERTDIQIDAAALGTGRSRTDIVSVIVEVKGCWNDGLFDAMQTQLVDRYLKESRCRHGLYVVGWFNCAQWDSDDRRRDKPRGHTLEQLKEKLRSQAEALSIPKDGVTIKAFVLNASLR